MFNIRRLVFKIHFCNFLSRENNTMFVKLLVPIDFSSESENSLQYALAMAKEHNAKLMLVHVCKTGLFSIGKSREKEDQAYERLNRLIAQYEQNSFSRNGEPIEIESKVLHGRAADEIIRYAVKYKTSFIIMGFKGEGLSPKSTIGHNTLEVILRASVPVISIPPNAKYKPIQAIAYTNHNARTENTNFNTIIKVAEAYAAEIIIVRTRNKKQEDSDTSKNIFSHKKNIFKYQNINKFYSEFDDLSESMNACIKDRAPDLIALGIHEEDFFNRMVRQLYSKEIALQYQIPLLSTSVM